MRRCSRTKKNIRTFFVFLTIHLIAACVSEPKKQENSLITMIKNRDIDGIKARFSTSEINTKNQEGYSPLHIAVRKNDAAITEYLLTMGADIEETDPDGNTPLIAAVQENAFDAARILALHNARLFAANRDGVSAFVLFNEKKQTAVLFNPHTVLQTDKTGKMPLHYAVEKLDRRLVSELLAAADDSAEAALKAQNKDGQTALELAYARPEEKAAAAIAALLLHAGARPLQGSFATFETATLQRNYAMRFEEGRTALHIAAASGDTGFVQYLLEQGCPADVKNTAEETPLHEAVRNGHTSAAAALLDAGAQPDTEAAFGNTALHSAITAPHRTELVNLLLGKRANPAIKDKYGETPLHIAVRVGADTDILRALTNAGAPVDARNKKGETPLLLAVNRNLKKQAAFLISRGADIHAEDTSGITPFVAAVRQHREMLGAIVTKKTSALQDSKGRNALHLAVLLNADNKIFEYLIRQRSPINASDKAGNTPLHYAVINNRKTGGTSLLTNGADIFVTNKQGESPLKIAFMKETGREIWLLTDETVAAADSAGETPLHYAASWGMTSIIPYIISRGGNINAKNGKGETPLFAAVKANQSQAVTALFEVEVPIPLNGYARDFLGNTVLHTAIEWDARKAAETVLHQMGTKAAALLNAKNTAGKTVLHVAAQKDNIPFITLCLAYHADINRDDATGGTPLADALRYGKNTAALFLLKKGASPTRQDIQGRTALHEAIGTVPASTITALRNAGADPLVRDSSGVMPLSRAFFMEKNILEAVLGADSSLSNSDGQTPLHIAVQEKVDEETMRFLISKKYTLDKRDKTGSTALLLAVRYNAPSLCAILLESGADPFSVNNAGESALSLALTRSTELLKSVWKFTASKIDSGGNGFFHYAARYASIETIQLLLSGTKAGLDQKNLAGEIPADIAARWQRPEIAVLLQPKR